MEIELKWGLKHPGDLNRLLAYLPVPDAILVQNNHYFTDPLGRLSKARTMVRVREEGLGGEGCAGIDKVVLTVKRRLAKDAGVFRAEETEELIEPDLWHRILYERATLDDLDSPALKALKAEFEVEQWNPQGMLLNKRHVVKFEGYVLEIDRTTFDDGHVDAEVEVETEDIAGAKQVLSTVGEACGIEFFDQTHGKYSRFLRRCLGA